MKNLNEDIEKFRDSKNGETLESSLAAEAVSGIGSVLYWAMNDSQGELSKTEIAGLAAALQIIGDTMMDRATVSSDESEEFINNLKVVSKDS